MERSIVRIQALLLTICLALSACNNQTESFIDGRINDYNSLIKAFKDPGIDYRPAPLWVWNNDVSKEDIDLSLRELKRQGMGGVYIHPRRGLITEYLSDRWFDLVAYSMEKAKELGLKPRAGIVAQAVVGSEPVLMLTGPITATPKAPR